MNEYNYFEYGDCPAYKEHLIRNKKYFYLFLVLSLLLFICFISFGSSVPNLQVNPTNITIGGSGEVNITWINATVNNKSLINSPSAKIWDIAIPIYFNSSIINVTFSNFDADWIRLNTSAGTISFLTSSSPSSLFIYNVTFSSWNGTDYDWNHTDSRASLTFSTSNVQIINGTFRNLGNVTWQTPFSSYGVVFNGGGAKSNITNSFFLHNYMGIHSASTGMDNATIYNNYFFNQTYDDVYISVNGGNKGMKFINNIHNRTARFGIEILDQAAGGTYNFNITNNTFYQLNTSVLGSILLQGSGHLVKNNNVFASGIIGAVGITIANNNNSILSENFLTNSQYNFFVGTGGTCFNITIQNNTITNGDEGSSIRHSSFIYFLNNTIKNMTFNYDGFDAGLRVKNSSYVFIEGNNWTEVATTGMFIQKSNNVTIKNNFITMIPMSQRSFYRATDYGDPVCAISLTELYKSYLTGNEELFDNDNITYIGTFKSDNVTILGNTITNANCLIRSEGTTNLTHDLTNYIYKNIQGSIYYPSWQPINDPREYWLINNFGNLSSFYTAIYNNTILMTYDLGAVTSRRKINFQMFNDYTYLFNSNQTATFGAGINNQTKSLITFSNGSVACSNINSCNGNINISLAPQDTWSSRFDTLLSQTAYAGLFSSEGVYDSSPITNIITTNNTIFNVSEGKPISSYTFNGINSSIIINDTNQLSPNTTGEFTVSFWVKINNHKFPGKAEGYINYINKNTISPTTKNEWAFRMYNDTSTDIRPCRMSFYIFNESGGTGIGSYFQDNNTATTCTNLDNTWMHVVGGINSTSTFIYRDAVLRDSDGYVGQIIPNNTMASMLIGVDQNMATYFNGTIDEIMVFNRTLNQTDINALYQNGLVGHNLSNYAYVFDNANLTEGVSRNNFPITFSTADNTRKIVSSTINPVTMNVYFTTTDCSSLGEITYIDASGQTTIYDESDYSCSGGIVGINNVALLGQGASFSLEYGCDVFAKTGFSLIMILSSVAIVVFVVTFIYRKGLGELDLNDIVLLFMAVIIAIVFWTVAGQNLGGTCGVVA